MNITQSNGSAECPIFVVGCGHSGTSLVARLIGAHTRIFAIPGETCIALSKNAAVFREWLNKFQIMAKSHGCKRWVEKTPRHIHAIKFLLENAPDSRIVICIRDPRDVCYSLKKRHGNIESGIKRWAQDNLALQPFINSPACRIVRYEYLVENPESEIRSIMDFVGENYEASQLSYHEEKVYWYSNSDEKPVSDLGEVNHNQNRNWQINQPLFDGRGRWKIGLLAHELTKIKTILGPLAKKLGYNL